MKFKNLKISEYHHDLLKKHCEKNGLKIKKVVQIKTIFTENN